MLHEIDATDAGVRCWFYGGQPPPEPQPDRPADSPAPPPDRVREPDERRAPPVRDPRTLLHTAG